MPQRRGKVHRSACTQGDGRQHEGRTQAQGQGKGQGLSSDGIHAEDVEISIVRGEQSFLHFSCWTAAKGFTRQAKTQTLQTPTTLSTNANVLIG